METCYLLFGSNLGDKESTFAQACTLINNRCGKITAVSSSYESEPWGFESEEWFLNRVIVVETGYAPDVLMRRLLDIEAELGRVRHPEMSGYVSRSVDLDILYYGARIVSQPDLTVPHPRLHLRRFVLVPMCEVASDFVHPVLKLTQQELLLRCPDNGTVRQVSISNE